MPGVFAYELPEIPALGVDPQLDIHEEFNIFAQCFPTALKTQDYLLFLAHC